MQSAEEGRGKGGGEPEQCVDRLSNFCAFAASHLPPYGPDAIEVTLHARYRFPNLVF